jgi:hypothetical protein
LSTLGLIDALELPVLSRDLPLLVLKAFHLLFFLVSTLLELRVLGERIVQSCVEHFDLLLALLCLGFSLLQALLEFLQICSLFVCCSGVFLGGAIDLR